MGAILATPTKVSMVPMPAVEPPGGMVGRGGSYSEGLEQHLVGPPSAMATRHYPHLPPGALGCCPGRQRCSWTRATPGWIQGPLAADG